ncbi:unnamed protein product, partial [marine sediment metagenome]
MKVQESHHSEQQTASLSGGDGKDAVGPRFSESSGSIAGKAMLQQMLQKLKHEKTRALQAQGQVLTEPIHSLPNVSCTWDQVEGSLSNIVNLLRITPDDFEANSDDAVLLPSISTDSEEVVVRQKDGSTGPCAISFKFESKIRMLQVTGICNARNIEVYLDGKYAGTVKMKVITPPTITLSAKSFKFDLSSFFKREESYATEVTIRFLSIQAPTLTFAGNIC